ncbi:T9SS type A sorting domain-containing protein [Taibaiella koreensis]|uniref:T9SS type A sorting domain-containing protein n=1 Tax=Taibaiella koreensis TaxID=1268548 RepID=UPI000E599CD6|nr:T9SS type A sorting domain-containing protein [Taibaiella koreensis]
MRSSLLNKRTLATGLAALTLTAVLGTDANAQLSLTGASYTQDFNSIASGLPVGWTVRTGATATILGTDVTATKYTGTVGAATEWANFSGGFRNAASATPFTYYASGTTALQASETNRALSVRQVGATSASFPNSDSGAAFVLQIANTTGLTAFNLSFKLQSLDSTSARVTTWKVDYGFGSSPTTFTPATTTGTMTTGGNTYANHAVTVNFGTALDNQSGPVYIRIVTLNNSTGASNRTTTGIDDYTLTWTGAATATNIQVVSKTPTGTGVPLSTNTLHIKYDNPVAIGTGNVRLYKASAPSAPVATFNVTTAATANTDSSVTITGMALENNTNYFVNMDAGAVTKTGGTLPNEAITGATAWTFSTVDTTGPAAMTSLNETFASCNFPAMGVFVQYSVAGTKTWRCSTRNYHGTADTFSVYINGGSATGISEANDDWLISKAPFDFSALTSPELSLWQYRHFDGNVTRTVKISTNYVAGTNPNSAIWTTLTVPAMGTTPTADTWEQVAGIDLTPYKSSPFYIAFTYNCGTDGAYELTYDDIKVQNKTVGIFGTNRGQLALQVLGDATANAIQLGISLEKAADVTAQVFDMTGRKVYSQALKVNSGRGVYTLSNTGLQAGMYVIRITNGAEFGSIKAMVK